MFDKLFLVFIQIKEMCTNQSGIIFSVQFLEQRVKSSIGSLENS